VKVDIYRFCAKQLDINEKYKEYRAPMKLNDMTKQVFIWHRTYLCGCYERLCVKGLFM